MLTEEQTDQMFVGLGQRKTGENAVILRIPQFPLTGPEGEQWYGVSLLPTQARELAYKILLFAEVSTRAPDPVTDPPTEKPKLFILQ